MQLFVEFVKEEAQLVAQTWSSCATPYSRPGTNAHRLFLGQTRPRNGLILPSLYRPRFYFLTPPQLGFWWTPRYFHLLTSTGTYPLLNGRQCNWMKDMGNHERTKHERFVPTNYLLLLSNLLASPTYLGTASLHCKSPDDPRSSILRGLLAP
jgi:hypothetical protein